MGLFFFAASKLDIRDLHFDLSEKMLQGSYSNDQNIATADVHFRSQLWQISLRQEVQAKGKDISMKAVAKKAEELGFSVELDEDVGVSFFGLIRFGAVALRKLDLRRIPVWHDSFCVLSHCIASAFAK